MPETSRLDRAEAQRGDAGWVATLWRQAESRVLLVDDLGLVAWDPAESALRWKATKGQYNPARHFLVGMVDGQARFTRSGSDDGRFESLRQVGHSLDPTETEVATTALALVSWHRAGLACPACGGRTTVRGGGGWRFCAACARELFPRIDPAVIVAVVDADDRLLLAHQAAWPRGRVSLLAGFVEVGESLEQTVRREIDEEVGLEVGRIRYVSSQPWPFPRSLMLGFVVEAQTVEIVVDGVEIESAGWYSREDLHRAVGAGEISLPASASIAHRIINRWLAGDLPG